MELLLNLVWLAVASTALIRWTRRSVSGATARARGDWRLELFALGCALVLLFPIISVSDDLQAEPAAVEANGTGQPTVKKGGDQPSTAAAKPLPATPGTGPAHIACCSRFLYHLDDLAPAARSPRFTSAVGLRAPPSAPSL